MENKLDVNELIKVEALPKIMYQLEIIGAEVDKRLAGIEDMECNEENKQEVKKRKQEITAFKNLMETRRKDIKKQVMAKYDEFNDKYEEEVKSKLENAEEILKAKYTKIELEQIEVKTNKLKEFAYQHIEANNLQNIINFDNINLNITLSASEKSLKEKVVKFIEDKVKDLQLIELEEYKDEILLEYKKNLDFATSKIIVSERHRQLEEMQQKVQEIEEIKEEEQKVVEQVEEVISEPIEEEITAPKEVIEEDEILQATFTVKGTKEQLKQIVSLMKELGVDYRNE